MRKLTILIACLAGWTGLAEPARGQEQTLEYLYRYNCQPGPDHLMSSRALSGDRAIVASNKGLALIDLAALPVQGTSAYLSLLPGTNARDLYLSANERYVFVNAHRKGTNDFSGFDVVGVRSLGYGVRTTSSRCGFLSNKKR